MPIEHLDQNDWAALARYCPTRPIINGSFAFHHISDIDGRDVRDDVFLHLRSRNPEDIRSERHESAATARVDHATLDYRGESLVAVLAGRASPT